MALQGHKEQGLLDIPQIADALYAFICAKAGLEFLCHI
jgi:hypothetical protein